MAAHRLAAGDSDMHDTEPLALAIGSHSQTSDFTSLASMLSFLLITHIAKLTRKGNN